MSEPVRVAQVVGKMVGGGLEAVVMNYYRHIDRDRYQFDFIVDSDSTLVPADEIESLGGRVIEVPPYQKQPSNSRALEQLFRQEKYQIVHSHMNALSVFPLHAAAQAGVPIRIAHSHSTSGRGEYARNLLKAILRTQSNRYPTDRLACSRLAGDWLFGTNVPYTVIHNAIDLQQYAFDPAKREKVRQELGIGEKTFVVGNIGRLTEQKNQQYLIEAFANMLPERPDSALVIAGMGPLEEKLKSFVHEIGMEQWVHFVGQRSDADALYSAFDVFCLPSLYEGLPVVGVEAQASGVPCIFSTDVTDEVILTRGACMLNNKLAPEEWARALLKLPLADSNATRCADGNLLKGFDITHEVKCLEQVYAECLSRLQKGGA